MVSPEIVMLSVFMTPCTNPTSIHWATSDAWAATTASNSARDGRSAVRGGRVVTGDGVVGEAAQQVDVARGPGVLEAPHAQMAARDPGEQGSGQHGLPDDRAPRGHHGEGTRRRDAERVHRLADDVLAQHRPDRGQTVTAAGERRAPRALEVQVARAAVGVGELTEQECAAVAETRDVPAELVPGVGLGHRRRTAGDDGSDEEAQSVGAAQHGGIQAELGGQRLVEDEQLRVGSLLGRPGDRHLRELAGEPVVQGDGSRRRDAHATEGTGEDRTGQVRGPMVTVPARQRHRRRATRRSDPDVTVGRPDVAVVVTNADARGPALRAARRHSVGLMPNR